MGRIAVALSIAAVSLVLVPAAAERAGACVGRTLYVGYHDAPDQRLVANLLSVFIDERTGTTVKLAPFGTREEALDALRRDRISLYADHSGIVLSKLGGGEPDPDAEKTYSRLKELLNRKHNVIWLVPFGYDRDFSGKAKAAQRSGPAGLMLCKDALAKFPALPKLLGKLSGLLDNDTMAALLREAETADPRAVARRFLKSRKLV